MAFQGIDLPPFWRVLPASVELSERGPLNDLSPLRIKPGRGFGVGNHETTQLCLLGLGHYLRTGPRQRTVLDFGAGSGILSIAAALSGAHVQAVDLSEGMIGEARARLGQPRLKHPCPAERAAASCEKRLNPQLEAGAPVAAVYDRRNVP